MALLGTNDSSKKIHDRKLVIIYVILQTPISSVQMELILLAKTFLHQYGKNYIK